MFAGISGGGDLTPYFQELRDKVDALGGHFNAHLHLDRAGTYHRTVELLQGSEISDGAALPISGKHSLIPLIHESTLYDPERLHARLLPYLNAMVACGTSRADSVVDVTTDRVQLSALKTLRNLKQQFEGRLDFKIGAYSPLGFRDDEPERWSLLVEGAEQSDFIGLLPERDDSDRYPEHIGFKESCRRALLLADRLDKKIHIHTDQANHRDQSESELIVSLVEKLGLGVEQGAEPFIWLIHVISPSTYGEPRFLDLARRMADQNIGVICCPSAAVSMRQYRPVQSPTYNCIARVLDFLDAGVWVRLGSDNVCDIISPMGTVDLMDELAVLGNTMRFYNIDVLARIGAGQSLTKTEIDQVRAHIALDAEFVAEFMRSVDRDSGDTE
ncbi:MAG: hypothetical protein ACU0C9_06100 [Paracoccaceae bacterium]